MGVNINAWIDAEHDVDRRSPPGDQLSEEIDLVEIVDHDPADTSVDRFTQLGHALVVAVKRDFGGRHAGTKGHEELAAGDDIDAQSFFPQDPDDSRREKGLGGIDHAAARIDRRELIAPGTGDRPQRLLVIDVDRCAMLLGEPCERDPADLQDS